MPQGLSPSGGLSRSLAARTLRAGLRFRRLVP